MYNNNRKKNKGILAKVLSVVLLIGIVLGLAVGVVKLTELKTKTVSSLAFKVGGLDDTETDELYGKYKERKDAIYTPDAIECQGLTITPDFDSKVKYRIFWYNFKEECCGISGELTEKFLGNVPDYAKYCRIMIIPNLENGEEINFWEVAGYAKYLTIKVNRKQVFAPIDYYKEALNNPCDADDTVTTISEKYSFFHSRKYVLASENPLGAAFADQLQKTNDLSVFVKVDCSNADSYIVFFNEKYNDGNKSIEVVFFFEDGKVYGNAAENSVCFTKLTGSPGGYYEFSVPEGAMYLGINVPDAEKPIIINQLK